MKLLSAEVVVRKRATRKEVRVGQLVVHYCFGSVWRSERIEDVNSDKETSLPEVFQFNLYEI